MRLRDALRRRQLLVVTGKGGVGKSALAATLGRTLAADGIRVALLEVDPRESLYQMLDVPPSGGGIVRAGPNLYLQNLNPQQVMDRWVEEHLRVGFLVRRVLGSPVYRHFTAGAPGLRELAVLGQALRLIRGHAGGLPRPDVVVMDAPASGHGVSLLASPSLVAEVIQGGPFGHMAREIAALIADRSRCAIVLVTTCEEMPVQETLELIETLHRTVHRRPELVVANGLYPPVEENGPPDDPLLRVWRRRREGNLRERRRLREHWPGPLAGLPLLPLERGPVLAEALQDVLSDFLNRDLEEMWAGATPDIV